MKNVILKTYIENWQVNGMGMLDENDVQPWDTSYNVRNDNGILFSGVFEQVARDADCDYKLIQYLRIARIAAARELNKQLPDGLYNRKPLQVSSVEAQDNYAAIASLNPIHAESICSWGSTHLWNFNNQFPHTWTLRTQRQPGEVAYYKICANIEPGWFSFLYFLAGIFVNAISKASPSDTQLCWFRIEQVKRVGCGSQFKDLLFENVKNFWKKKLFEKWPKGMCDVFKHYYRAEHPIHELAKLCDTEFYKHSLIDDLMRGKN